MAHGAIKTDVDIHKFPINVSQLENLLMLSTIISARSLSATNAGKTVSSSLGYIPALDTLRAVAVFAVMWSHFFPDPQWQLGIHLGSFGVRLFFVLSAFLITGIILDECEKDRFRCSEFMIKRMARLYPCLLLFLLCALIIGADNIKNDFLWHAFYLSNILFLINGEWAGYCSHLWTIAVEQQFYIIWPIAILTLSRMIITKFFLGVIFLAPMFRYAWMNGDLGQFGAWVLMPAVLDSLGVGALLAVLIRNKFRLRTIFLTFLTFGIFLKLLSFYPDLSEAGFWKTSNSFFYGCAIIFILSSKNTGRLKDFIEIPIAVYLGKVSYGIYMYHLLVAQVYLIIVGELFGYVADRLLWMVATCAVGAISFQFFENPTRAWILAKWTIGPLERHEKERRLA